MSPMFISICAMQVCRLDYVISVRSVQCNASVVTFLYSTLNYW